MWREAWGGVTRRKCLTDMVRLRGDGRAYSLWEYPFSCLRYRGGAERALSSPVIVSMTSIHRRQTSITQGIRRKRDAGECGSHGVPRCNTMAWVRYQSWTRCDGSKHDQSREFRLGG